MKVKELIEELQKLDQEKEIKLEYDCIYSDIGRIGYDDEEDIYVI